MWKWIHQLGKPERLYQLCGRFVPWFAVPGVAVLLLGWVWGFGFAPPASEQGDGFRIIYIHVPAAIQSMGIYAAMAIAAFVGLVWQWKTADLAAMAMAPVGAVYTFIALATGSAWGKPMWGTWWQWDARMTSELVLLFLYIGAIALYHAFEDRRMAARAAGIVILVGVINLPIIHYSVNWWNTVHQGSSGVLLQAVYPTMRTPLLISVLGAWLVFVTLTLMRLRNLLLHSERHRPWAVDMANRGGRSV